MGRSIVTYVVAGIDHTIDYQWRIRGSARPILPEQFAIACADGGYSAIRGADVDYAIGKRGVHAMAPREGGKDRRWRACCLDNGKGGRIMLAQLIEYGGENGQGHDNQ